MANGLAVKGVEAPQGRPATKSGGFGFGGMPRARRRVAVVGSKSDQELIAEYLKHNEVKKGPPRYADGAVRETGAYQF